MRSDCADPFDSAPSLEVIDDRQETLATGEVTSIDADYYRLETPSNLVGDLVYFELIGSNLELTLYDSELDTILESDGADFFGSIGSGLGSSSLTNKAIAVEFICRGPCIIVKKGKDEVYLKIKAKRGSPDYELYSFNDTYQDEEEPNNNDCGVLDTSAIIPLPIDQEFTGALETIKDIDCYKSDGIIKSIALQITSKTSIDVNAEIFDLLGNPYPDSSTNTLNSLVGDTEKQILAIDPPQTVIVRVATDGSRAAAAGNSRYKLSFEKP